MEENQNPASPQPVVILPAISDTFGYGWVTLKKNFPEMLLVLFIIILFSLPMGIISVFEDPVMFDPKPEAFGFDPKPEAFGYIFFTIFNIVYGLVVMAPLSYGASWLCLKAIRGENFKVTEIFFAFRQTLQIILANLLVGVIVGIGFAFLIIPGIIFACKLSMVPYLVMDRNMEAVEAVRKSWNITKGHSWVIFGMAIVSFLIIIGGIILLLVGIFPAIIWIWLSFAGMYQAITQKLQNA